MAGRERTLLEIRIGHDSERVALNAERLLAALGDDLRLDLQARLREAGDADGYVALQAVNDTGLIARFDPRTVTLEIELPMGLRRLTVIGLRGPRPAAAAQTYYPAPYSAYVNVHSGLDYVWTQGVSLVHRPQPIRIEVDGAVNIHDWVLEGRLDYLEGRANTWRRSDLRLVRDDPERLLRFQAGDLAYSSTGFQTAPALTGVSLARSFELQPYRVTAPSGSYRFMLESESRVDVRVNGRSVRRLRLPPGPYDLRNFRFGNGLNDVVIRITDDSEHVREIAFPFSFDSNLLTRGTSQFSYSVGFPWKRRNGQISYDLDRPSISIFHRRGLSSWLTTGVNLQGDRDQRMAGVDTVIASALGTFRIDTALSRVRGFRSSYAARVRYEHYNASERNALRRRWVFSLSSRGRTFAPLGVKSPDNRRVITAAAGLSQDLPWADLRSSMTLSYEKGRGSWPDTRKLSGSLRKRITGRLDLELSMDRRWTSDGEDELSSLLTLTLWSRSRNRSTRISHETSDHSTRIDWHHTPDHVIGGVSANAHLVRRPDSEQLGASLHHVGPRMEADLAYDGVFARSDHLRDEHRWSLRAGTALAFAGGRFGISRPIANSFALIVPHPTLQGTTIGVDPSGGSNSAQADRFGPAVLPNLTPYEVRSLTVAAANLPVGYDLGVPFFQARPTYRSGVVIPVGGDAIVEIRGTLIGTDGSLMALEAGFLTSVDDPEWEPVTLFTNRKGRFASAGLRPGTYELRMHFDPEIRARIVIPEEAVGRYRLGELRLEGPSR